MMSSRGYVPCSRVHETVYGVRPVHSIHQLQQRFTGDIDCCSSDEQESAYVGSWIQACFVRNVRPNNVHLYCMNTCKVELCCKRWHDALISNSIYTLLSCCNYLLYKLPWSQVVLLKTSLTCTLQTQKGNKKALSRGSNVVHLLWPWTIYDLWPRTSKSNLTKTVSRCIKLACQISQSETILFKSWVMTHIHVKTPDQLPDPVSMTWTKDRNY